MDSKYVPLLSPFNYTEWKLKMCAYLKRQCLYDVSIGALSEPESSEEKNEWLNDYDRAFGVMCLAMSSNYPFELWSKLDTTFDKQTIHLVLQTIHLSCGPN